MSSKPRILCAVYTRKSTTDGLEQEFNSLDAQHEACSAYVASQRHEGWKLSSNRYDDGGISGGTLERPALQTLLKDIDQGRINMVVVYKIDRLTRSLADFAKLVELLDAANCSFVSVTQAFNTSTSMGRLTLNVLLSFAQFEREVTAERIRDKIAASKKKGMWMGGLVPLGYDKHPNPDERGLIVNAREAKTVCATFELYQTHGCLRVVQERLMQTGIRSKRRIFANGRTQGGTVLSRGQIHFLLTNPIYVGLIRHKDKVWPGLHEAIIDQDLWDAVQQKLQEASNRSRSSNKSGERSRERKPSSSLAGKFRDETGDRLTPTHTKRRGKQHRYYASNRLIVGLSGETSTGWRLPAAEFEQAVANVVTGHFESCVNRHQILANPNAQDAANDAQRVSKLITTISRSGAGELQSMIASGRISAGEISVELDSNYLATILERQPQEISPELLSLTAPFQLRKRGVETRIVAGEYQRAPDPVLLRTLTKAHDWIKELRSGKTLIEIARKDAHSDAYIRIRCQIAFLSPRIQEAIINGTQPIDLTLERIITSGVPLDWSEQARVFGFDRYAHWT